MKEIREREIAERESVKRGGFSLVWSMRELVKRDYISWVPPTFYFSSLMRRKCLDVFNSKTVLLYFSKLISLIEC